MFRYIDDVLSLNNSKFGNFVDRIYPIEHEVKNTTDADRSADKLYHLQLRVECTLFVIYTAGREPTPYW
jgi:hypothetical protein